MRRTGTLRRLLAQVTPLRHRAAAALVLGVATVAASVGLAATAGWLITTAAFQPSIAELSLAVVGVRFFGVARGLGRYLERLVSHDLTFRLLARLRLGVFRALEPLAPARLAHLERGDLLARAVADVETLQGLYVRALAPPLVALATVAAVGALLAAIHPGVALTAVLGMMLTAAAASAVALHRSRHGGAAAVAARGRMAAAAVEGVEGLAELTAWGRAERLRDGVAAGADGLCRAERRDAGADAAVTATGEAGTALTAAAVLAVAVPAVAAGRLDGAWAVVAVLAVVAAFEAILPLPTACRELDTARAAGERLFALADTPPAVAEPARPAPVPASSELRLRGVGYTYPPTPGAAASAPPPALAGVDLDLRPGRRVAVVGPSGAGKSTLVQLLFRFIDPDHGSVTLGGTDLRRLSLGALRRRLALVAQDVHLFTGTLRDNLAFAAPEDTSDAALRAALESAGLGPWLARQPAGLDVELGQQGQRLSGGERRRLAVARALLADAPVLVLDEGDAGLDPLTARVLDDALAAAAAREKAVLVVTHRFDGLEAMDEIVVLDRGRVVERGRHRDLWRAAGLYRRLAGHHRARRLLAAGGDADEAVRLAS